MPGLDWDWEVDLITVFSVSDWPVLAVDILTGLWVCTVVLLGVFWVGQGALIGQSWL